MKEENTIDAQRCFTLFLLVSIFVSLCVLVFSESQASRSGTKQTKPDIFNMSLNKTIKIKGWHITKVPGGWIYKLNGTDYLVFVNDNNKENTK